MNQDQQARDDRAVSLNLDAILLCTEQVTAPQQLLEHAEEQFDQLAMTIPL